LPLAIAAGAAVWVVAPSLFIGTPGPVSIGVTLTESSGTADLALEVLLAVFGILSALVAFPFPRVGGWLLILTALLSGALSVSLVGVFAWFGAAVTAFSAAPAQPPAGQPAPEAPEPEVSRVATSGQVAAVVRLVQYGRPVGGSQVSRALADLEELQRSGGIDEQAYAEYSAVLSTHAATGAPT